MMPVCLIRACETSTTNDHVMCAAHWRLVPAHIKDRVWATWRARQAAGHTPVTVQKHVAAKLAAVRAVHGRNESHGGVGLPGAAAGT